MRFPKFVVAAAAALFLQAAFAASLTQFGFLYNYGSGTAKQALPSTVTFDTNTGGINIPGPVTTGDTNTIGTYTFFNTNGVGFTIGVSSALVSNTFLKFPDAFNGLVKWSNTTSGGSNVVTLTPAVAADLPITLAPSFVTLTDGATITLTCDASKTVQNATVTLGGNRTLAISGVASGMGGTLIVKQDGTGSRTLALPAGSRVYPGGGSTVTLTTTASGIDVLSWSYDGTNYHWAYGTQAAFGISSLAASTSADLAGVLSDETGTGNAVFSASPTFTGTITAGAITMTPPAANTTALTINGISLTGSSAVTGLDLSGTFNTSGAPDFLRITVTNTASSASANTIHIKGGASGTTDLMTLDASQGNLTVRANITSTVGQLSGTSFALGANGTLIASGDGAWQVKNSGSSGFTSLQFGPDVASSPANPILKAAGGLGTDKAGGNFITQGGASTGTGRGGALIGQTSPSSTTGSSANAYSERFHFPPKAVTLTESSATTFATIACASGKFVGGNVVVTINADDGTDFQCRTLRFTFSAVNKAGTVTAGIDTPSEAVAVSTGTLSCTITAVANGNAVDLKANAVSSLTQTTLNATVAISSLNGNSTAAVTEI